MRIAVTGVGLMTPLGTSCAASWPRLLAGDRAGRWLAPEELSGSKALAGLPCWAGAPIPDHPEGPTRLVPFALRAAREAVEHAQLSVAQRRASACVIGTSKTDLGAIDHFWRDPHGSQKPSALAEALFPSSAAAAVALNLGCEAAVLSPVAACATGLVSLIQGASLIRSGAVSTAIAGGADASLHPGLLASYRRLGVLARSEPDPAGACRPFDRRRNGFIVGEGGAVLVLEDWQSARERGAPILAEWVDGIFGSDPSGITSVDATGTALAELVQRLLHRTGVRPDEIDAINVHGTATKMNDLAEGRGLQKVFGRHLETISTFGLKGSIGHLMGGAGAVETAACVLALANQVVPPTANHLDPDPDCPLRFQREAQRKELRHILKVSLGFGGHLAAALLRRTDQNTG